MTGDSATDERPARLALGAAGFFRLSHVSRETFDRLCAYVDLLTAWNRRINLVGPATLSDVWRRHILDSAQLLAQVPPTARCLVDLGSGAGLPGLILSIMGVVEVHLVESDQRKAAFLREAVRITGASAVVHPVRIERLPPLRADVVTARALAPLTELIDISKEISDSQTLGLFLKGAGAEAEIAAAQRVRVISVTLLPSASDPAGRILRVKGLGA